MRPRPVTIKLGEAQWQVRPLTLRQVQEIEPLLLADPQAAKGSVAAAIQIVSIALNRDHPDAAANLPDLEASARDLSAAMVSILELGGFITRAQAETEPGEVYAGAD
ncbi:MAG: hypothetical protein ACLPID_00905 [Beijerinckiaceae bacterium]